MRFNFRMFAHLRLTHDMIALEHGVSVVGPKSLNVTTILCLQRDMGLPSQTHVHDKNATSCHAARENKAAIGTVGLIKPQNLQVGDAPAQGVLVEHECFRCRD
jgi:hypothetical protein